MSRHCSRVPKLFFYTAGKLELYDIPHTRKSQDKNTNNNNYKMIEICKNNNLFILNGRLDKDRNIGAFTFRHQSVIDYMLSSVDSSQFLEGFEILETDPLFSDGHCILTCIFTCPEPRLKQQTFRNNTRKPLWNEKFAHIFLW